MGNPRFNSFDLIAKTYAETKPIRGQRLSEDLRPLFARRYWWMRVEKLSDTKYALHDGMWGSGGRYKDSDLAPIVWERKEDGDYITIRNCPSNAYAVARYNFLSWCVPSPMYFWFDNGKHYVKNDNVDCFLPKFKANFDWQNSTFEMLEDNKLVFKAEKDGTFTRANELQPKKTRRLDKDLKAKYDPMIAELWEWGKAVLPILGTSIHANRGQYSEALCQTSYWYWDRYLTKNLAREIVENPEHDKRLSLVALAAYHAGAFGTYNYKNDEGGIFEPTSKNYSEFRKVIRKVVDVYAVELC